MDPELQREQQQEALKQLHKELWEEKRKILDAPRKSAEVYLPPHEQAIEDAKNPYVEEKPMWLHPDDANMVNPCAEIPASFNATHRHLKTGGLYTLLYVGILEKTLENVAIYQDRKGVIWVRPLTEFNDGRFEKIT